ncbi:Ig-like domain-containing protein [Micromonospora sp. WMMD812]|uniref:Ig-like domain-containing protein n=1 Tax=Micromonospora sp. WMMD812 TaxID=3015152 RepID=UPI00248D33B0|nr:Ig-like domain-containing protein [Micromonospora sp. WMMD812]WBB65471.1 Ig-like domain-containing protein [Micromonospora sp. WMMD812]
MSRRGFARLAALGATLVLSLASLITGVLITFAGPAQAASLGEVTLSQSSGVVTDTPMFESGTTGLCPTGYGENANLRVGKEGPPFSNLAPVLGGGGYDNPEEYPDGIRINPNRSFQTALGRAPEQGAWWVVMECYSLTEGRHDDEFRTPIFVCGDTWRIGTSCSTAGERTTTTLSVSPEDRAEQGEEVTLTANVDPPAAAGEVVFRRTTRSLDGTNTVDLGTVPVSGGTAVFRTSELPVNPPSFPGHELFAVFQPADESAYQVSTSERKSLLVVEPGTTTVTLTFDKTSPAPVGAALTLTASVAPPSAGTMHFDRYVPGGTTGTEVGSAAVAGGTASITVTDLPRGRYEFQARFVATDEGVADGVSVRKFFQVGPTETEATLTVLPAGSQPQGTERTLTARITPANATGTVQFRNGTNPLGEPAQVVNGQASLTTTALAVGTHSLTAVFTPAQSAEFEATTSPAVSVEVTGPGSPTPTPTPTGEPTDEPTDDPTDPAGGGGGGGSLPRTGLPLIGVGLTGLTLVGAGATAMVAARRRQGDPEPVRWPDDAAAAQDEDSGGQD